MVGCGHDKICYGQFELPDHPMLTENKNLEHQNLGFLNNPTIQFGIYLLVLSTIRYPFGFQHSKFHPRRRRRRPTRKSKEQGMMGREGEEVKDHGDRGGGNGGGDGDDDERRIQEEDGRNREGGKNTNKNTQQQKVVDGEREVVELVVESAPNERKVSKLQTHSPVTPIQVFPTTTQTRDPSTFQPRQVVYAQPSVTTLNSRNHTNRISLFLFLLHLLGIAVAVCFFSFKAIQGILGDMGVVKQRQERQHLMFWLPPIEGSVVLAIFLAFMWQKAIRVWPGPTVKFILWCCFGSTMVAGILLICFALPSTTGLGVALILFSIGNGLYACWVTRRIGFAARILANSLRPTSRFPDLNHPTYVMLFLGFIWISIWCFAVVGALNFYYPPLTILLMVLSLMWTAEVIRNVANLTVSRVVALYYLRGMQSNTKFCFMRAVTKNLGSACLGSLFVPAIEACRIMARGLNLLEGEDEFLFSCAHCCLRVMEAVFRYGNSWAFVHIAAYGRGFVAASESTWGLFEKAEMEPLVDSDITSSICFLSGVSSGAICAIFAASWTFASEKHFTATVSLLAFFVGYLMTRIGMALPQACVGCYYICYAENPSSRLFDSTIPDRISYINNGRDVLAPTPHYRRPRT